MVNHLNIDVASGLVRSITLEDKWISTQSQWTDDNDSDKARKSTLSSRAVMEMMTRRWKMTP